LFFILLEIEDGLGVLLSPFKFLENIGGIMSELSSFEVFVLSSLFLVGLVKFIPIRKNWGDIGFQKWQAITSFLLFFLYIIGRVYIGIEKTNTFAGILLFLVYLVFLLFEFANLRGQEKVFTKLISPISNFSVLFGEIFLLVSSLSKAQLL
jgi:hypothetical protein